MRFTAWLIIVVVFVMGVPLAAQQPLVAFFGAEGFGATTSGGRGGQVMIVTTLAPDGPGSLAEALATQGARTIVFEVSGVIHAVANMVYGDVTIAGQTSPGGITVRGLICDGHYDANDCDNLIIRHIRSRPARHIDGFYDIMDDALRLDGVENVIIDHVSLANAADEVAQISLARNVTVQNTIMGETVGDHAIYGGMLINYSHSQRPQDRLTIHHNLWYRITNRYPEISCEMTRNIGEDDSVESPSFCGQQPLNIEVSNNLLWDARNAIWYGDNRVGGYGQPEAGLFLLNMNWVNNLMYTAPDFTQAMLVDEFINQPQNQLYFAGNRMNLYPDYQDLQLVYCCNDFDQYHPSTLIPAATMRQVRHDFPPITYTPTEQLTQYMLENVGAFPRDPMDTRYMESLRSGVIPDVEHERAVADDALLVGFDPANPPTPPLDGDRDGMPDDWESAHGLDPNTPSHNGLDLSAEGYTNLEVYLNALAEQRVLEK